MIAEPDDSSWRKGFIRIDIIERWLRPMTWAERTQAIDVMILRLAKGALAVPDRRAELTQHVSMVIGFTLHRFPIATIESYAQAVILCICFDEARRQRGRAWIWSSTGGDAPDVSRLRDFPGLKLVVLGGSSAAEWEAHYWAIMPLLDAMPGYPDDFYDLKRRIAWPLSNKLLHGNFSLMYPEDATLRRQIWEAARSISDGDLARLLEEREWRSRLTAAWLIALTGRAVFADAIGERLLASEFVFAGQGYCVALALIGGPASRKYLCNYLTIYLPLAGRDFDQLWAAAALAYLESQPPQRFLDPALWIGANGHRLDPIGHMQTFREIIRYARQHGMIGS
jgi:hypothetical protein